MKTFTLLFIVTATFVQYTYTLTPEEQKLIELASSLGQHEAVKQLLDSTPYPININAQDTHGYTALMRASFYKHIHTVRLLIQAGADLNKQNRHGESALILAVKFGDTATVKALIDAGAHLNIQDNKQRTALHYAARRLELDFVSLLLRAGIQYTVDYEDRDASNFALSAGQEGNESMLSKAQIIAKYIHNYCL